MNEFDDYNGSLFGANPVFLQEEKLELASYQFCMQIYGGDFPEEFQDIFYLDDAIGYLFLSKEEKANDVGVFFVQCTWNGSGVRFIKKWNPCGMEQCS